MTTVRSSPDERRAEFDGAARPTRISIAMCNYNGAAFLPGQLASLLVQTRRPDELVVCDDGSSDRSVEILKKFAERAPFAVRVEVNEHNLGVLKNFEKAISLTTGDVVVLCCNDDVWVPEKLERIEEAFRAPDVGLALSDAELIDEAGRKLGRTLWRTRRFGRRDRFLVERGRNERLLRKNLAVTYGMAMAFRSSFNDRILPIPPEWLVEDAWIAVSIAALARVALIPERLVGYRQHSTNASGAGPPELTVRIKKVRENTAETFLERARRFRIALDHTCGPGTARFCKALAAAERHMLFRAELPPSRVRRAPLVLRELLTLGYARYSDGWRSAAADLVLR